jgi:hypothetical protein
MTEDEALERLAGLRTGLRGDAEVWHSNADDLAWEALRVLGWTRLADQLELDAQNWWYA